MGGQGALFDPTEPSEPNGRLQQSAPEPASGLVVRVVPDVRGMRQPLDYLVPEPEARVVEVGSLVDVELGARRLRGWVVGVGVEPPVGVTPRQVQRLRSVGPEPEVTELTAWGAWRFAGARSALLATASSSVLVRPPSTPPPSPAVEGAADGGDPHGDAALLGGLGLDTAGLFAPGCRVVRIPPAVDTSPLVVAAAQRGPTLVITPSQRHARRLIRALQSAGHQVVGSGDGWARARAGGVSVVGTRVTAWAPCHPLAAVVVLDEHDEALVQEHTPTWHARTVAVERARRAGVPCLLISPVPSLEALTMGPVVAPSRAVERAGWPAVDVVDQRLADPLLPGLLSERLVGLLRSASSVLCVLNRTGRARLLACDGCGSLARCATCGAAVSQDTSGELVCGSCRSRRPVVCASCGRSRLRTVRRGVTRVREDLEAMVGEPVGELTAGTEYPAGGERSGAGGVPRVVVGTTAALHRLDTADVVAFLDFDQELTAPRYRASEEAMGLLARAARLVAPRNGVVPGRILVQTSLPDHPVLAAAVHGDPERFSANEATLRADLRWPPAAAVALVSHSAAEEFVAGIEVSGGVEVLGPDDGRWVVRAPDHSTLCNALDAAPRPLGRLRIEVDPLRL